MLAMLARAVMLTNLHLSISYNTLQTVASPAEEDDGSGSDDSDDSNYSASSAESEELSEGSEGDSEGSEEDEKPAWEAWAPGALLNVTGGGAQVTKRRRLVPVVLLACTGGRDSVGGSASRPAGLCHWIMHMRRGRLVRMHEATFRRSFPQTLIIYRHAARPY